MKYTLLKLTFMLAVAALIAGAADNGYAACSSGAAQEGALNFDTGSKTWKQCDNAGAWVNAFGSGGGGGGGDAPCTSPSGAHGDTRTQSCTPSCGSCCTRYTYQCTNGTWAVTSTSQRCKDFNECSGGG